MKLGRTNDKEIDTLMQVLNEVEQLNDELSRTRFEDIDFTAYDVLGKYCRTASKEDFLDGLLRYLAGIHFQRILMNCSVMLEQCTDPELSHLDFSKDIKAGLELLESQRNVDAMLDAAVGELMQAN